MTFHPFPCHVQRSTSFPPSIIFLAIPDQCDASQVLSYSMQIDSWSIRRKSGPFLIICISFHLWSCLSYPYLCSQFMRVLSFPYQVWSDDLIPLPYLVCSDYVIPIPFRSCALWYFPRDSMSDSSQIPFWYSNLQYSLFLILLLYSIAFLLISCCPLNSQSFDTGPVFSVSIHHLSCQFHLLLHIVFSMFSTQFRLCSSLIGSVQFHFWSCALWFFPHHSISFRSNLFHFRSSHPKTIPNLFQSTRSSETSSIPIPFYLYPLLFQYTILKTLHLRVWRFESVHFRFILFLTLALPFPFSSGCITYFPNRASSLPFKSWSLRISPSPYRNVPIQIHILFISTHILTYLFRIQVE